jgi:putative endonuclease
MPGCWVYILKCADAAYYVGSSRYEEIEARVWEHQAGHYTTAWTKDRRPVELVWTEHFDQITDAIAAERRIKGWRRDKKEALIRGDYNALPWLAKRSGVRARGHPSRLASRAPQDEDRG